MLEMEERRRSVGWAESRLPETAAARAPAGGTEPGRCPVLLNSGIASTPWWRRHGGRVALRVKEESDPARVQGPP